MAEGKGEFTPQQPIKPEGLLGDLITSHERNAESYKNSSNEQDRRSFGNWMAKIKEIRDYERHGFIDESQSTSILAGLMTETEREGLKDKLTGLMNEKGFSLELARAISHASRHPNEEHAVMFLDLDGFKGVNDGFGHKAGDKVLEAVAAFISSHLRESDIAARWGGDEFVVIVEGDSTAVVEKFKTLREKEMPEYIKNTLQQYDPAKDFSSVHVSTSLGVKRLEPGDTVTSVIESSDKAMYQDKHERKAGR